MRVRPYIPELDDEKMLVVMRSHGVNESNIHNLPAFGLIAFDQDGMMVGAGFLRHVEGHFGILDSFITNPKAPSHLRHRALNIISRKLITLSKRYEIIKLIIMSSEPTIIKRCMELGFEPCLHQQIATLLS